MIELPTGIFWGNLYDDDVVKQVIERQGNVAQIRAHYRGWSGAPPGFAQAGEREMLIEQGWSWLDKARQVELMLQDTSEHPQWAEVRITTNERNGQHSVYKARVEVSGYLETISSTGKNKMKAFPQYVVV